MSEHFISRDEAESDLLACAAYIAESIIGGEAKAAAIASVVPAYLARGNVDLAAELANSVDDPFTRDRLLIAVAEKCAELNDDEYAIQLAEAIEEPGFQAQALERVGLVKARAGDIPTARDIAARMAHPDRVLALVAVKQAEEGDTAAAFATIDEIEYAGSAGAALNAIAAKKSGSDSFSTIVDRSLREAAEIEHDEERINAYVATANLLVEANDIPRAIETLELARTEAEMLGNVHRDSLLAHISLGYLNAGNVDLADTTLDGVGDKTQIAAVLLGFARDYWRKDEKDEAFDALEEAHAILKSQRDTETRDSKAKFSLFTQITSQFAGFERGDRALELAEGIEDADQRNASFSQIARIATTQKNDDLARHALASLAEDADKAFTLIGMGDGAVENGENEHAAGLFGEAVAMIELIPQPSLQASASTEVVPRLFTVNESQKARTAFNAALTAIADIRDDSKRAGTLAALNSAIEKTEFRLSEDEIAKLKGLLRADGN